MQDSQKTSQHATGHGGFASPTVLAANKRKDRIAKVIFTIAAIISGIMIVLITVFICRRGIGVFLPSYGEDRQDLWQFLTGNRWRADQGVYGVGFIIINTLLSAFFAALISFPLAVLTALMITRMAPKQLRTILTTAVEVLAAIPSVVYGVFAAGVISQWVVSLADIFNYHTAGGNSFLNVVLLLAIMIFPTMTDLAISAINAVDPALIEGSLALGATPTQTNFKMVLRAARSGIFSGLVMGLGRAFGEATAVSMVAGNSFIGPSVNPFNSTRTLTSTMLSGFHETSGVDYDIRFSVGIVLIVMILITNGSIYILKRKFAGGLKDE